MKNSIHIRSVLVVILCTVAIISSAQKSVTIGAENLNGNAVLTLVSEAGDQGFILPVVENKENIITGLSETGMLVYENATSRIFLWDGSNWIDIVGTGSVSITSINDLNDVNTSAVDVGHVLKWDGTSWQPAASDVQTLGFDESTHVLSIENGNTVDLSGLVSPGSGSSLWTASDGNAYYENGNVGVGTTTPASDLHVVGDGPFPLRVESTSSPDSGIEFVNASGTQGYLGNIGLGSDMAMGTVDGNTTGNLLFLINNLVRMNLSPAGNLGIGTLAPDAKLHVDSDVPETLRLQSSQDGVVSEFYNVSGRVGYLGSLFNNNMDFGTVSGNTNGRVYLRTQGLRRLSVSADGNVGIGTISPGARLDVYGGQWDVTNTEGDFRIGSPAYRLKMGVAVGGGGAGIARVRAQGGANQLRLGAGDNDVVVIDESRVEVNGEVNTPATGNASMLPVAYGYVTGMINKGAFEPQPIGVSSGSGNFQVFPFYNSAAGYRNIYIIRVDGVEFSGNDFVAIVTPTEGGFPLSVQVSANTDNDLQISFTSRENESLPAGTLVETRFSFVIYKP